MQEHHQRARHSSLQGGLQGAGVDAAQILSQERLALGVEPCFPAVVLQSREERQDSAKVQSDGT